MQATKMPSNDGMAMESVKKSLLRYLGNNRDVMRGIVANAENMAQGLDLSADAHNGHVLELLAASNTVMHRLAQQKNRGKTLLEAGAKLPPFQSERDPYGLDDPALLEDDEAEKRLQKKHDDIIRAVGQVAMELGASKDTPYAFLKHTDQVYQATLDLWAPDGLGQCRSEKTWSKHMCKILQFMRMIGEPTEPLFALFKDTQLYAEDHTQAAPPKNKTLSPEETEVLRGLTRDEFFPQAMAALGHPQIAEFDEHTGPGTPIGRVHRMKAVHDAIAVLYLYGSTPEHTLQRRDLANLEYKTINTDTTAANYVSVDDGEVTITLNSLHKVKLGNKRPTLEKLSDPLVLDVSHDNAMFAELLLKYEAPCKQVHTEGPAWALFMYVTSLLKISLSLSLSYIFFFLL